MKIKENILDKIIEHARKEAPIEACGYLAALDGVIVRHYELKNIDQSPEHFSFDPQDQFSVVRDARSQGLEVCAVYHSHPASPARPSEEDIRLAYDPSLSYVIVSLSGGQADVKSFKIVHSNVVAENIEVMYS